MEQNEKEQAEEKEEVGVLAYNYFSYEELQTFALGKILM